MTELTQSRLRELLHYCPERGVFTWIVAAGRRVRVGDVAGYAKPDGYRQIMVNGKQYYAHRLARLYMTGAWPKDQIDHINGVTGDNRWANLREATHAQNQQNMAISSANKSGYMGVSWHGKAGNWQAQIKISGRNKHLGYFTSPEDAHAAYLVAKANLHTFQPKPRIGEQIA